MKKWMLFCAMIVGFAFVGLQAGYAADAVTNATPEPKKVEEKTVKAAKANKGVKKGIFSGKKKGLKKEAGKVEEPVKK